MLKRDVCQHLAALKTDKRHHFHVILIQINCILGTKGTLASFWLNFSKQLANVPPLGKMLANVPPKTLGGYMHEHCVNLKEV